MDTLIILILVVIRLLATGIREGYTQHPNPQPLPWLKDYHSWRTVDVIIFGIILGELIGYWLALNILAFAYCFIYERALQWMGHGEFWHPQSEYDIQGFSIPITNTHMIIMGSIGFVNIILIIFNINIF